MVQGVILRINIWWMFCTTSVKNIKFPFPGITASDQGKGIVDRIGG